MKDEGSDVGAETRGPISTIMRYVYRIPVIGWAFEGVLVDKRPKARFAGLFVLVAAPTVAVALLGKWGSFVPFLILAVLVIVAFDLVYDT